MTARVENDAEKWPCADPCIAGVQEHYQRVQFFLALAKQCPDPAGKFRLLLAGVYSARAVVELMLDAADKERLNCTRNDLEDCLPAKMPWYDLIKRIRLHDFHRFGIVPPDPRLKVMIQRGPIKLRASKGAAIYRLPVTGPEKLTTGNSRIEEQRPLLTRDGEFFDDATRQWIKLDRILLDFIRDSAGAIEEFETKLGPSTDSH